MRRRPSQTGMLFVITVLVVAAGAQPGTADTKITMQEGTELVGDAADMPEAMREAIASQEPTTAVYWFGKDRAARVGSSGTMISRLDRGEAYLVNDQSASCTVIELDGNEGSVGATGTAELVKTGETRTIRSWSADRFDMTLSVGGELTEITLWVSDDVDADLSAYRALIRATAAQTGAGWMLKLLEIDGFPVRQEFRTGPLLSWQQVVSISDETAPAGIYEPPSGCTRSD